MGTGSGGPAITTQVRYAGITFRESSSGDSCEVRYRVPKSQAKNILEAASAPGVPKKWDRLVLFGRVMNLYCTDKVTEPASQSVEEYYTVICTFTERKLVVFDRTIRTVDWRVGTTSFRAQVSVTGKPIGSVQSFDPSLPDSQKWENIVDRNAEVGADDLLPTLDFVVRVPSTQLWNPVLVSQLMNGVNLNLVTLQNVIFPPGTLLFVSGEAKPIGPLPTDYEVMLYFQTGWKILPDNLPAYYDNTLTLWDGGSILPIKYGTYPRVKLIKNPEDPNQIIERRPTGISVYVAKRSVDFQLLRY